MSTYTIEDFMDCEDIEAKAHICLHLIKDYEMQVQIPLLSNDEYPLDALQFHAYSSQLQAESFDQRYHAIIETEEGPMDGTVGPMVLCGLYEGFCMLIAGHECGAVPSEVVGAYGSMMVASARSFFYMLSGCEL